MLIREEGALSGDAELIQDFRALGEGLVLQEAEGVSEPLRRRDAVVGGEADPGAVLAKTDVRELVAVVAAATHQHHFAHLLLVIAFHRKPVLSQRVRHPLQAICQVPALTIPTFQPHLCTCTVINSLYDNILNNREREREKKKKPFSDVIKSSHIGIPFSK